MNIILDRIYNKNLINTSLTKRTLKKLILDCCTKTPFFNEIVRKLIDSNVIKFYARYVDDTLVVAKPSDFTLILETFNTFHPQIQFTLEEFPDNKVYFLDLKINTSDITIYRKPTHTGQYTHLSSFTPWSRKTAWIRALVNRAYEICSNHQLLQSELKTIKQFMSWNGFSRNLTNKLIHGFTSRAEMNNNTTHADAGHADSIPTEQLTYNMDAFTIYWQTWQHFNKKNYQENPALTERPMQICNKLANNKLQLFLVTQG